MDKESLFFTIFIMWYFTHYGAEILNTFNRLHNNAINFLELFTLYFEKYNEDDDIEDEIEDEAKEGGPKGDDDDFIEIEGGNYYCSSCILDMYERVS